MCVFVFFFFYLFIFLFFIFFFFWGGGRSLFLLAFPVALVDTLSALLISCGSELFGKKAVESSCMFLCMALL